ncbi:hypothetical protein SDC9_11915 [bioreactor metagenome]|uniref:Uncharacterized protein n=1 Tax=bioreactor metagenome TaxID=1076179 RepID=A0A644TH09_9ZZZZ
MDIKNQLNTWGKGLHHSADTLMKRGTVMSGIIPTLFLPPVFIGAAWLFKEYNLLLLLFSIIAIVIVAFYLIIFFIFAIRDPDRLQSEEYRCEVRRINMIAGSGLMEPIAAENLALGAATFNSRSQKDENDNEEVSK